ncbi:MAG: hypothetical protein QNK04_27695 [Myxococcota bacterium]|nr:hypothetical protein [Myxococcota bacterium]
MTPERRTLALRIALTVTAMEFFGPAIRDAGASHALNPDWVGHARVHLVWLLGFMVLSGFVNLYFIWFRRPVLESLRISALWQTCNLGGFWVAVLLNPAYEGSITVPGIHVHVFGIDENVFAFSVFSLILAGAWLGLRGPAGASGESHAAA